MDMVSSKSAYFFTLLFITFLAIDVQAETWTSQVADPGRAAWTDGGIWDNGNNISGFGTFDVVNISNGDTITYTGTFNPGFASDVNILSGGMLIIDGDLDWDEFFGDFTVSGGLLVTGDVTVDGPADFVADGGFIAILGDLNISANGNGEVADLNGGDIFVQGSVNVTDNGCTECAPSISNEDNLDSAPQGMQDFIGQTVNPEQGTTLPVSLVSQEVTYNQGQVYFSWSTASEKDNDYFEILRSSDGESFEVVGIVKGNGTSQQRIDYRFIDRIFTTSELYYKLRQVDYDGQYEVFPMLVVQGAGDWKASDLVQMSLTVYPNPNYSDELTVSFDVPLKEEQSILRIYDLNGSIALQNVLDPFSSEVQVTDLRSYLTPGIYILTISQGDQTKQSKVVLK